MTWRKDGPQGNETGKIRWHVIPYLRGRGLDLGCGATKVLPSAIGVDNLKDNLLFGTQMRPDIVADIAELSMFASGSMDYVFSSHALEHFPFSNVPAILREWMRVLKVDGHLVLYLPDANQYPRCPDPAFDQRTFEDGANPDHKWNVTRERVLECMRTVAGGADLLEFEIRSSGDEYSLLFVFRKLKSGFRVTADSAPAKAAKTVGVVRYGAFGDMLQTAAICAGLKRQGYHVTLFTSHPAHQAVEHDPNIDRLVIQDLQQVPNEWCGEFWCYWRTKFDRWINFSECVETTLLAQEHRPTFEWAPAARHALMNRNYLENMALMARVPLVPTDQRFYPTEAEREWARRERAKMRDPRGEKVLLWVLAGSSRAHKSYPYLDEIVHGLIRNAPRGLQVVLVGHPDYAVLEDGLDHPRIHKTCGKWSIRQVLAFLEHCDVVVGPETGVMNAAAMLPMPKLVFLSHSTRENLTRDWVNTASLYAPEVQCGGRGNNEAPACHQMHIVIDAACRRHRTGVAQCMGEIRPTWTWDVLRVALSKGDVTGIVAPYIAK